MSQVLSPVCDRHGQRLLLGRELGRGGEGVVHELPAHADWVAKRYHQPPDAAKQQKLKLMAESIDSPLREYAAWPEETLHDERGAVIGFTMQRIEGRLPIHMLYSPAQRRESFPQARFDFLVFVARNIAAAFETLHAHGHVLGDVNQGNVLVGADSRVILIDCDSFQIQVGEALHRCEVGVAHFTPPELQSIASFEDITRTPNHDSFGLALLIFHLLMGGRHPYSGVPLAAHVGESLEADIRDFRYAYAHDARERMTSPPPRSVPIGCLSPEMVALFERAFTERAGQARPVPSEWVAALDTLRAQLRPCAKSALHLYGGHQDECPWCLLDQRHVTLFGAVSRPPATVQAMATIDVDAMEKSLVARSNLPQPFKHDWAAWPVNAWGPDRAAMAPGAYYFLAHLVNPGLLIYGAMLVLFLGTKGHIAFAVLAGLVVALIAFLRPFAVKAVNRDRDRGAWTRSQFRYERLLGRMREVSTDLDRASGAAAVQRWCAAHRRWQLHMKANARAIASVSRQAHDRGLRHTLAGHTLAELPVAKLQEYFRTRLQAAGVETAADFDAPTLAKLRFLSRDATKSLLEWRADLARDYQRQHRANQAPEVVEAGRERSRKQRALEQELLAAYRELQQPPADPNTLRHMHEQLAELGEMAKSEFNQWSRMTGQLLE